MRSLLGDAPPAAGLQDYGPPAAGLQDDDDEQELLGPVAPAEVPAEPTAKERAAKREEVYRGQLSALLRRPRMNPMARWGPRRWRFVLNNYRRPNVELDEELKDARHFTVSQPGAGELGLRTAKDLRRDLREFATEEKTTFETKTLHINNGAAMRMLASAHAICPLCRATPYSLPPYQVCTATSASR